MNPVDKFVTAGLYLVVGFVVYFLMAFVLGPLLMFFNIFGGGTFIVLVIGTMLVIALCTNTNSIK